MKWKTSLMSYMWYLHRLDNLLITFAKWKNMVFIIT